MYSLELILCLCFCYVGVTINAKAITENSKKAGYYWKGYVRDIPHDALPGGVDKRGKITYIGHTMHLNGVVVPGQIREAEQKMTYEWGYKEYVAKERVQILCTEHPEQFKWIETNVTEIKKLDSKLLVPGGIEQDYKVYIGRIYQDGEIAIGKVLVSNHIDYKGVYTTIDGRYVHVYKSSYEVLAYNASAPIKIKDTKPLIKINNSKSTTLKLTDQRGDPNTSPTTFVSHPVLLLIFLKIVYCLYI